MDVDKTDIDEIWCSIVHTIDEPNSNYDTQTDAIGSKLNVILSILNLSPEYQKELVDKIIKFNNGDRNIIDHCFK